MVVSVDMVLWSDKIGMDAVEAVVEKVSDKVDKNLQAVFFAENRIFFFFFGFQKSFVVVDRVANGTNIKRRVILKASSMNTVHDFLGN